MTESQRNSKESLKLDSKEDLGTKRQPRSRKQGPLDRPQRKIEWDTGVLPGNDPVTGLDYFAVAVEEGGDLVYLGQYETREQAQAVHDYYIQYQKDHAKELGLE